MSLGKHKEAQEILDSYNVKIEKYFTPDHPASLAAQNNQALLNRFDGQYQKAYDSFIKVTTGYKNIFGDLHPSVARSIINLGTTCRDLQKYEDAIKYYDEAMKI